MRLRQALLVAAALHLALPPTTTAQGTPAQDATPPTALRLPAFTGYAHHLPGEATTPPTPPPLRRRDEGSVERCEGALHFYVHFAQPGELSIQLERTAAGATSTAPAPIRTTVESVSGSPTSHESSSAALGTFRIAAAGPHRITLQTTTGEPLRELQALQLSGPAVAGAHANVAERRNAASVHLGYPVPKANRDDIAWFYVELTPKTDPLWTYYMATGWHRGYFGMQVNSPTERRIIFSVWDAGDEAIDRGKVAAKDRVTLVAKGDGVYAGDFGNEGTGGHSHWKHGWRLGETFRFLMHAAVDGDATVYSGWFWLAAESRWRLIASFRAPKDGRQLHGLYSFSENFDGQNGDAWRECEFGNGWVRTTAGQWLPLQEARFTHDETGQQVRRDRWAGARGDRFYLRHGDFTVPPADAVDRYGESLRVTQQGKPPSDAELPAPPKGTPR